MYILFRKHAARGGIAAFLAVLVIGGICIQSAFADSGQEKQFIRYVEFNPTFSAMERALELDIRSHEEEIPVNWVDLLAIGTASCGGNFSGFSLSYLDKTAQRLQQGETIEEITRNMPYYAYYREAYGAVLDGLVGEYEVYLPDESGQGGSWKRSYGLKAFSPIAEGWYYEGYDDFGQSRTYGYARRHLGHDMLGSVGTPVVAVESGRVEAVGWNQYGGWRIGIRSLDGKRYYYYAHLRKDHPYTPLAQEGCYVTAGDVIGYLGQTGYSLTENTNNIEIPHLHFGLELIFDESQKESDNEIWVDVYALTRLLSRHRCTVVRDEDTGEYKRAYAFREVQTSED